MLHPPSFFKPLFPFLLIGEAQLCAHGTVFNRPPGPPLLSPPGRLGTEALNQQPAFRALLTCYRAPARPGQDLRVFSFCDAVQRHVVSVAVHPPAAFSSLAVQTTPPSDDNFRHPRRSTSRSLRRLGFHVLVSTSFGQYYTVFFAGPCSSKNLKGLPPGTKAPARYERGRYFCLRDVRFLAPDIFSFPFSSTSLPSVVAPQTPKFKLMASVPHVSVWRWIPSASSTSDR